MYYHKQQAYKHLKAFQAVHNYNNLGHKVDIPQDVLNQLIEWGPTPGGMNHRSSGEGCYFEFSDGSQLALSPRYDSEGETVLTYRIYIS